MKVSSKQFTEALEERTQRLDQLPEVDFLKSFASFMEVSCEARLPRLDELLVRQGPVFNGNQIDLSYCRPSVGRGRDLSWRVIVDIHGIQVRVSTGDYGEHIINYVADRLRTRLHVLTSLASAASPLHGGVTVWVNETEIPVHQLNQLLSDASEFTVVGEPKELHVEVKVTFSTHFVDDLASWVGDALEALTPLYLFLAPPVSAFVPGLIENQENKYPEGAAAYKLHRVFERDARVISEAKRLFKQGNSGRLFCQVCGFDFEEVYGPRGQDYAEGHHREPVSKMGTGAVTRPQDIAIVCSNCHRMLHRSPFISPEQLSVCVSDFRRNSEST